MAQIPLEALKIARDRLSSWREDPVKFVWDNFFVEPDEWQKEALRLYAHGSKKRLGLKSCAGPGKSALLAWIGWHFLSCYFEGNSHPKCAALSCNWDNLKDNLWAEFSKWQSRSKFLMGTFSWTAGRIFHKQHKETYFLSARGWQKKATQEEMGRTLSGLHADYVLILVDESGDIPVAILRTAEQAMSKTKFGKIVQAGNPTSHDGMLFAAANNYAHLWDMISITGDPDDPKRSPRIDVDWAREQIKTHGRDNPWVKAYILGQFPPASINAILGHEEVREAMGRHVPEDEYIHAQKRLGIDVARFGNDRSVIFPRQGLVAFAPEVIRNARTTEIAAKAMKKKADWGSEMEFVDDTGHWGHGVIDTMISSGHSPIAVMYHGPPVDPRYKNKRAEMWMEMAEWIRRGGSLPNLPEMIPELTTPTYTFVNGKFMLEPKDRVKERLGRSPDLADGLANTFCFPEMPGKMMIPGFQVALQGGTDTKYSPLKRKKINA